MTIGTAVVAVALIASAVLVMRADRRAPLAQALAIVEDDGRFGDTRESAATFAEVASITLDDAGRCDDDESAACEARLSAAAYAQVLAAGVLRCTRRGIHDAREAMRSYLRAVETTVRRSAKGLNVSVPEPPLAPTCAGGPQP